MCTDPGPGWAQSAGRRSSPSQVLYSQASGKLPDAPPLGAWNLLRRRASGRGAMGSLRCVRPPSFRGMRLMRTLLPRLGSLVFACVVLSLPAAAQDPGTPGTQLVLTPGDSVRIVVWRKPEFSGDFVVAPDGSITHPLFRDVKIAGVPLATAEANLRRYLTQYDQNPQFVMEPLLRVSVSGEVTRPLVFAVQPGTS